MSHIAVILTVHDRCDCTISCLNSLSQGIQMDFDVYMTDDGCTDGTPEKVHELFPDVNILKGDGNLYWNRGMCLAFEAALAIGYNYYLWINDDTIVVPGFLKELIVYAQQMNNNAIVCGVCIDPDSKDRTYGVYTKNVKPLPISEEIQTGYFSCGNLLLIPSQVTSVLGNIDNYFRHSLGDFDYCGRAVKAGFKVIQSPGYLAYCRRHTELPKWRDKNYSLKERLNHLYSPTGRNPYEFLHFDVRHYGIITAVKHYISIHLRCILPTLFLFEYTEKE